MIPPHVRQMNEEMGRRVMRRREAMGLSAAALEGVIGAPRGSVKRIERGEKGLDCGLLAALSRTLGVDVAYFFDGLPPIAGVETLALPPAEVADEVREFLEHFHAIDDETERRQILALVRAVAENGADDA